MSEIKEHRIYKYLSEPFRVMGLTVDEMAIGFGSVMGFIFIQSMTMKGAFVLIGTLGVYLLKKFKKMSSGFSLMSYLHWKLGIRFKLPAIWPESWKRYWLP